jgi:hypothetical protein
VLALLKTRYESGHRAASLRKEHLDRNPVCLKEEHSRSLYSYLHHENAPILPQKKIITKKAYDSSDPPLQIHKNTTTITMSAPLSVQLAENAS